METANAAATHIPHSDGPNLESSKSGIHWASIIGGAVGATAVSAMLVPLGSAFGFSSVSAWRDLGHNALVFSTNWAIWLVVMQWLSSLVGGYIAGRLRVKWADTHSDEVFFRDTVHGFLAWGVATLFTAMVLASVTTATVNTTADVAPAAAQAAASAAGEPASLDAARPSTREAVRATEATETSRKAIVGFSFVSFLSLLIGAFIASVAAALGGRLRDKIQ
jgi:hypothetical protein